MKMADRKLIELLIDEDQDNFAVEALSLVKFPAIESDFIFLSKQNRCLSLAALDEEKRTLIGPALIPDKHIPRFDPDTDEEYDVYFSQETVKRAAELFLEQSRTNEHTFEHSSSVHDVHVVESWLVQDPDMDKSKAYGLSVPAGTWMVRVRVDNDEVWESVKSGEVRGFSIEGYFVDRLVSMSQRTNPESQTMKKLMSSVRGWLKRLNLYQEANLTQGNVIATDAEAFAPGVQVYTLDEEGQPSEIGDGSYETEGGVKLKVVGAVLTEYDGEILEETEEVVEEQGESADSLRSSLLTSYYKKLLEIKQGKTEMSQDKRTAKRQELGYNGWRNWETWSVALYWVDDMANHREVGHKYSRDEVEEFVTEAVYDGIRADNFLEHIVAGFLSEVDWTSITEAANED